MKVFSELTDPEVARLLKQGAVGIIPTDTLYGIVASIDNQQAVERIYSLRHRDPRKACVVLIGRLSHITDRAAWGDFEKELTLRYWPGAITIALPITSQTPEYLHRQEQSIAYRFPDNPALQTLLRQTGPLIAPSANVEGQPPATTVQQAQAYFGDKVDFYVDGDQLEGQASTLIAPENGQIVVLRQGAAVVPR